jgi:hypothetical protein
MNCQEARERLPALIDEELAPAEKAEVEKHLAGCGACREEKRRQEQFTTRVKTSLEGLKPSDRFVKNVLERLDAQPGAPGETRAAGGGGRVSLAVALLVLAAAVAAVLVAVVSRQDQVAPVATVVGCEGTWLLARDGSAGRDRVPAELPAGARLETSPSGRAVLRLAADAEAVLGPDSRLALDGAEGQPLLRLERGSVDFAAAGTAALLGAGRAAVRVAPHGRVRLAMDGDGRLLVSLRAGGAAVQSGGAEVSLEPGETWVVPTDGSAAATRAGNAAEPAAVQAP